MLLPLSTFVPSNAGEPPPAASSAHKLSSDESDFFERRIRPVLAERCYGCHSARASVLQAKLRLDSAAGVRAGGESGPALVAGKPKDSLLIQAIRYESLEMPPDGKLPDEVIANFERWIEMGAPDPRTSEEGPPKPEPPVDAAKHWAFQPASMLLRQRLTTSPGRRPTLIVSSWRNSNGGGFVRRPRLVLVRGCDGCITT